VLRNVKKREVKMNNNDDDEPNEDVDDESNQMKL